MVKTLVLVRHGKAESRESGVEDAQRALTKAGKRSLKAFFPEAFALLDAPKVHIWTSPKKRALQTAEILAASLGVDEVDEHPCLAEEGIGDFLQEVADFEQEVVIAVGHNPFMEQAAMKLSSLPLTLEKGAVVALELGDAAHAAESAASSLSGELAWFVQGPDSSRWRTLDRLESVAEEGIAHVEQAYGHFLEEPEDDETLHRLRVTIRTERSLIEFLKPYLKKSRYARIQEDLRILVRETSRLREWDVLVQEVNAMTSANRYAPQGEVAEADAAPQEELTLEEQLTAPDPQPTLLEVCREARDKERLRVHRALGSKKMRRLLSRAAKGVRGLGWKSSIEQRGLDEDELQERYERMKRDFARAWTVTDFTDAEQAHALRKGAKKLRYIGKGYAEVLDDSQMVVTDRMVRIQDALGALCDARVAKGIIAMLDARKLGGEAAYRLALLRSHQDECIASTLEELSSMLEGVSEIAK